MKRLKKSSSEYLQRVHTRYIEDYKLKRGCEEEKVISQEGKIRKAKESREIAKNPDDESNVPLHRHASPDQYIQG